MECRTLRPPRTVPRRHEFWRPVWEKPQLRSGNQKFATRNSQDNTCQEFHSIFVCLVNSPKNIVSLFLLMSALLPQRPTHEVQPKGWYGSGSLSSGYSRAFLNLVSHLKQLDCRGCWGCWGCCCGCVLLHWTSRMINTANGTQVVGVIKSLNAMPTLQSHSHTGVSKNGTSPK